MTDNYIAIEYINVTDFFQNEQRIFDKYAAGQDLKISVFSFLEYVVTKAVIDKVTDYMLIMPRFLCHEDRLVALESLVIDMFFLASTNYVATKEQAAINIQKFLEDLEQEINNLLCSKAINQSSLKNQEKENNGL